MTNEKQQQTTKTSNNDKRQMQMIIWRGQKNNELILKIYAYKKGEKQFGQGVPVPILGLTKKQGIGWKYPLRK